MSAVRHVKVLVLGGSFEKIYADGVGVRELSFPEKGKSATQKILNLFGVSHVSTYYHPKNAKDSLDMDNTDRERIYDFICEHGSGDSYVIVHGTDTMIKTARYLEQRLGGKHIIILSGARQPACTRESDAEFNLGGAIIAARTADYGVHIVMNGQFFSSAECKKNQETGLFQYEWER